jgi:hypothetical protein
VECRSKSISEATTIHSIIQLKSDRKVIAMSRSTRNSGRVSSIQIGKRGQVYAGIDENRQTRTLH